MQINLSSEIQTNKLSWIVLAARNSIDIYVVLFGFWSIYCHLMVFLGLDFSALMNFSWTVPLTGICVWLVLLKKPFHCRSHKSQPIPVEENTKPWPLMPVLMLLSLLAALAVITEAYLVHWVLIAAILTAAYLLQPRKMNFSPELIRIGWFDLIQIGLAMALAVGMTLFAHRPDLDDSIYLRIATAALADPSRPLISPDSLPGILGAPLMNPAYRVYSFELFYALVSQLSGVAPIRIAHLVMPPICAGLSVLALSRLLRIIIRTKWALATLVTVGIFILARQTHWMAGNFAYVRLFQGKSIFLVLLLPINITYGLEYYLRPTLKKIVFLILAQALAIGLTANALFIAPLTLGLTMAACWRGTRASWRRLLPALTAWAYPLLIGLMLLNPYIQFRQLIKDNFSPINGNMHLTYAEMLNGVWGHGLTLWFWLTALTAAWTVPPRPDRRRWMIAFTLFFWLICLNPWLTEFWAENITGYRLNWRILWALPSPIWLALVIMAPVIHSAQSGRRIASYLLCGLLLGLFAFSASDGLTRFNQGGLVFRPPGLKVPLAEYDAAKRLVEQNPGCNCVLAPPQVAAWLPTFLKHPDTVAARRLIAERGRIIWGDDFRGIGARLKLLDYISGKFRPAGGAKLLEAGLDRFNVDCLLFEKTLTWRPEVESVLYRLGWTCVEEGEFIFCSWSK